MRFQSLTKLSIAMILVPALASAETGNVKVRGKDASSTYWTAARMAEARPMPSRQADDRGAVVAAPAAVATDSGASVSVGGRAPRAGVAANHDNLLFDAADRDVAAATALDAQPEPVAAPGGVVFTSAGLVPVSADTSYPYRTVGRLLFTDPGDGEDYYCSAAVIRNRVVATAADCVHSGTYFYENFRFIPAYRDNSAPYGIWGWEYVVVNKNWISTKGKIPNATDYALIEISDQTVEGVVYSVGDVVGFLGIATSKLKPNHAHVLGYASNFDNGDRLHQCTSKDAKTKAPANVLYGCDMGSGSLGGPFIQDFGPNDPRWIGTIGTTSSSLKQVGSSTPDSKFVSVLNDVCGHRPGNC